MNNQRTEENNIWNDITTLRKEINALQKAQYLHYHYLLKKRYSIEGFVSFWFSIILRPVLFLLFNIFKVPMV